MIDPSAVILGSLAAMVPIVLASVGEVFTERAGVVNIGLEGILLISALGAVMTAEATMNPWLGLLAGTLIGAVIGVVHGIISVYLKGDQIISGVGINLFALGLVPFAIEAYWHVAGYHQVPPEAKVPKIDTPLGGVSPIIFLTVAIAAVTHLVLHRTPAGLRVKAVGENPEAADALGVNVELVRLLATIYGAALTGLGGAYMSIDYLSTITKELSAGRGFIALANVVFARWEPLLALFGGVLFGFFDTLSIWIQTIPGVKEIVPWYFIQAIPYVVTLIVVTGVIGRARPPKSVGVPYRRE